MTLTTLQALSDRLNSWVIGICIIFLLAMLAISFVGFLYQLLTGAALSWTYSLARLFVPWIGMLSITVAFKHGEHVAMGILVRRFPQAVVTAISYVNIAIIGLLALLLIWFGWQFFVSTTHYNMVSDQLQIHNRFVAACIPVTGLIMLCHLVSGQQLLDFTSTDSDAVSFAADAEAE